MIDKLVDAWSDYKEITAPHDEIKRLKLMIRETGRMVASKKNRSTANRAR